MKLLIKIVGRTLMLLLISSYCSSCAKADSMVLDKEINSSYNIVQLGADNTGNQDCSDIIQRLIDSLGMAGAKHIDIYMPAGKYKISKRIDFSPVSFHGQDDIKGFVFRGDGEDVTQLLCDNKDGILFVNLRGGAVATNKITTTVRDLSFVATASNQGTALEFDVRFAGDHHGRMLQVQNVLIRGIKNDLGYFTNGILCNNAWYPLIDNVKITNTYQPNIPSNKMQDCIRFHDGYSPLITNSYIWSNAVNGIAYKGIQRRPEDGIVKDTYIVLPDNGIVVELVNDPPTGTWSEPAFHVTNCHINYFVTGIHLRYVRQAFISNNLVYCYNNGGSRWHTRGNPNHPPIIASIEPRDVWCDYASDVIISNNQFVEPASPNRIAVDISANSGNIVMSANIFNFDGNAAIRNLSQTESYASANVFSGLPNFTDALFKKYIDVPNKIRKIDY